MNIGDCPYDDCTAILMVEVPERTPAYAIVQCDECHRDVWYRLSRIDPQAWTPEDFLAQHDIDHETKTIKPKVRPEEGS